jgi:ABC-2 type transport system permease protein
VLNLWRHLLRRHARLLAGSGALLLAFELLICAIVATLDLDAMLQQIGAMLPPFLREALLVRALGGGGTASLLAFGWNHPVVHAVGAAVAIVLGSRAVAGEIEHGVLELVLAQPISRARYLLAHVLFAAAAVLAVAGAGVAGTLLGLRAFALPPLPTPALLAVGSGFALLCGALYGVALLLSAMGREGGRAAAAAFAVALVSFVVQAVATLWPEAAFLLPWSLHGHYDPRSLLAAGAVPASTVAVLGGVAGGSTLLAAWRFGTRDLP